MQNRPDVLLPVQNIQITPESRGGSPHLFDTGAAAGTVYHLTPLSHMPGPSPRDNPPGQVTKGQLSKPKSNWRTGGERGGSAGQD